METASRAVLVLNATYEPLNIVPSNAPSSSFSKKKRKSSKRREPNCGLNVIRSICRSSFA